MTNQALRIRSRLMLFNLLALIVVLAGCKLDCGTGVWPAHR